MNRRRHLAGGTGHAPVGDQRYLEAAILQDAQIRREFVQFGHAIGLGPLEAHHGNEIALQLTGLEGLGEVDLGLENPRRGLDDLVLRRNGRHLGDAIAEIALQHAQPAFGRERFGHAAQDVAVQALLRPLAPYQATVIENRLLGVAGQAAPGDGIDVLVQQAGFEQRTHHERHAAAGMEVVHVGLPIGVDLGQRRGNGGQVGHVLPGQLNTGGAGEGWNVQRVIGRAARGVERHHRVDDGLLVDDPAQRRVLAALTGQAHHLMRGLCSQRVTQRRVGVDEG